MSITLDLADVAESDVTVMLSPLAELMACLHVISEPDHHPEARSFVERVSAQLDDEQRSEIQRFSPLWSRLRCRLLFPLTSTPLHSIESELDRIRGLKLSSFLTLAGQGALGIVEDEDSKHLDDPRFRASYLDHCRRRSFHRAELAETLLQDPDLFREKLIALLESCSPTFFTAHWESHLGALSRAAERVTGQLVRRPVGEAIATLSPTAIVSEDGLRVRFDKLQNNFIAGRSQPIILVPSIRAWPHLTVKHDIGWPTIILFNLAGYNDADRPTLSLRQLSARLASLTSPLRLEVCRHLLGEPITTSELAARLGMAESQISRTLRQLRDSGLVRSEREGQFLRHRLATDVVLELGPDVLATITR